jgi:magnesium-transporting ATPase (P-type)
MFISVEWAYCYPAYPLVGRAGPFMGQYPPKIMYWLDMFFDTFGAACNAFLSTIFAHPLISAAIIILLVILSYVIYIYTQSAVKRVSAVYFFVIAAVLLIECFFTFFGAYGKELSYEMNHRKSERERIDYNAKTWDKDYRPKGGRGVEPMYLSDLVIDTTGAFGDAFFKSVANRPFIFTGLIILSAVFVKIFRLYREFLFEDKWHDEYFHRIHKNNPPKKVFPSLVFLRNLSISIALIIILCLLVFSYTFFSKFQSELNKKKFKRDKIDYKSKIYKGKTADKNYDKQ